MPNSVNSSAIEQTFTSFVDAIQNELDKVVLHGSDQQLFVASYLTGHFSLLYSHGKTNDDYSLQGADDYMISSLQKAFANKELAETDQLQVMALWQQIFRQHA
ncbi:MAG: hypothetical protein ACI9C4_000062 [Paraglaciecola sp.]|jgi:hypothetical protein